MMEIPAEGLILNVFKPAGMTSFDVVRDIRQKLGLKKVGHAGTLDPMAEGILLVMLGKATRKSSELSSLKKAYRAGILLGKETDTYDITGKVVRSGDASGVSLDMIRAILDKFTGEIEQVPPMYSALKRKGHRLYKLARQGIKVALEARPVFIYDITILSWNNPHLMLDVVCSKGTYVRSLAHDLGVELGCGACLESLLRTAVGEYRVEDSVGLSEIT